jgi:hypothetical protein
MLINAIPHAGKRIGRASKLGITKPMKARRRVSIEGLHGQATSDRSSDEGLCSKMDFVILKVRLTTRECQDQAMLLDRGVGDPTAIHTTPTVEQVVVYHMTPAA